MTDAYFDGAAFDHADPLALADSMEMQLIGSGDSYLSKTEFLSCFPAASRPSPADVDDAVLVVGLRASSMGTHYPFSGDADGISVDLEGHWQLYFVLLLLSFQRTPHRQNKDWGDSDPVFDAIVCHSLRSRYRHSLVFGWPRPVQGGFPEAVAWLAMQLGLSLRSPMQPIPTHHNDGGVDVVAWAPYADGGNGFPVLLVQDTIQASYQKKPRDIDPHRWRDWIDFGNTPLVGFAVPYVVSREDPVRAEVVSLVTEFMDRGRLMENLQRSVPDSWAEWAEIVCFADAQLREMRGMSPAADRVVPTGRRKKKPRPPRAQ